MPRANTISVDRKLNWIKDRLTKTIDIAMERVIAHDENPGYFPLPSDPRSLERAFHKLFETLPRKNKKDLIEKVNRTLKAGRDARTKIYGDLVNIDFRSTAPVVEQVKIKPVPENLKITEADVTELRSRLKLPSAVKPKSSKPVPAQAAEATELAFEVIDLTCTRPTDIRKDEMSIAAIGIDNLGGAVEVAPFFVGDFKKGETVALGVKGKVINFKLTVGDFPKTFFASIFMVEKDWLRNSDFVNGLQIFLFSVGTALTAISSVMVIVGLAGGPFAAVLTAVIMGTGAFFGLAWTAVRRMVDDVSFPNGDTLVIDAPVAPGTVFNIDPLGFQVGELKGAYQATARWVTA